ncbi:MAG: beta-propeller domain-containing protein [Zestosphaera sp.]
MRVNRTTFVLVALVILTIGISLPLASNTMFTNVLNYSQTATQTIYRYLTGVSSAQQADLKLVSVEGLRSFNSYEELSQYLKNVSNLNALTARLSNPYTRYSTYLRGVPNTLASATLTVTPAFEAFPSKDASQGSSTTSVSKTNVQVEGIDESDVVKTNGKVITVASGSKVHVVGIAEKRVLSTLSFDEYVTGLFLYEDELIVLTESQGTPYPLRAEAECRCLIVPPGISNITAYVFSISDASKPALLGKVTITGSLLSSRLSGSYLYIVTNMPFSEPSVPLVNNAPVSLKSLVAVDRSPNSYTVIVALGLKDLRYATYSFITGGGSWLYMSRENLYVAQGRSYNVVEAYLSTLEAFMKYLPGEVASKLSQTLREGRVEDGIKVVETHLSGLPEEDRKNLLALVTEEVNTKVKSEITAFYVFSIDGLEVNLRGSFEVPGNLLDQFAMEEMGNYFIVATTSNNYSVRVVYEPIFRYYTLKETQGPQTIEVEECRGGVCTTRKVTVPASEGTPRIPSEYTEPRLLVSVYSAGETSNNVFTVELKSLQVAGSLRGLASGERIYSARLMKNVFFLVTFRQVDPLFAIDLSNPESPKVLGYLKIPGFSEYLHPLPKDRLLGIGMEDSKLKISLFDVSDPTNMKEVASVKISPAWTPALHDHHAVTVHLDRSLLFIPVSGYVWSYTSGGMLVVTYNNDYLAVKTLLQHENAVRSVYVGDELYTVSANLIRVFNIDSLEELGEILLAEK